MTERSRPAQVGAPDPELRNSPIMEETDDEYEVFAQESDELPGCYFNGVVFRNGAYVCSGSGELLRCEKGIWMREGTCDPENP